MQVAGYREPIGLCIKFECLGYLWVGVGLMSLFVHLYSLPVNKFVLTVSMFIYTEVSGKTMSFYFSKCCVLFMISLLTGRQASSWAQAGGLRSADVCTPEVPLGVECVISFVMTSNNSNFV